MSSLKRQLFDRLREFYNGRDFVIGVMSNAGSDENYRKTMDFMDNES